MKRASAAPPRAWEASARDSVMACPPWFSDISIAMSRCGPPSPSWMPYPSPYSACEASRSPDSSLSRTAAHEGCRCRTSSSPYLRS